MSENASVCRVPIASALGTFFLVVLTALDGTAAARRIQAGADALPDAPGRTTVAKVCTACHGLEYLVPSERTVPVWRDIIELMRSYGAQATDEEWRTVHDYIMVNLAYLSVNKASAADVAAIFAVTDKIAQGVVAYRDEQQGFKSLDDLKKAPGLDAAKIDAVGTRLIFEPAQ